MGVVPHYLQGNLYKQGEEDLKKRAKIEASIKKNKKKNNNKREYKYDPLTTFSVGGSTSLRKQWQKKRKKGKFSKFKRRKKI